MRTTLKLVAVTAAVALIAAAAPTKTYAGDEEWATAGKVMAGIAAVGLIAVLASHADHSGVMVRADYSPPPRCEPPHQWIPGHYELQRDRVCLPAHWETVVTPAEYGWVRHGCRYEYVMVRPPCTQRVWVPERIEWRESKVWVPGQYQVGAYAYNR